MTRIVELVELVENEPMMDSVAVDLQTEEELDHAIERVVLNGMSAKQSLTQAQQEVQSLM